MKISELIDELYKIQATCGDLEVCHYNNMDYWKYPIRLENINIVEVKNHPDGCAPYCNPNDEWISGQAKFDKQPSFKVVSI